MTYLGTQRVTRIRATVFSRVPKLPGLLALACGRFVWPYGEAFPTDVNIFGEVMSVEHYIGYVDGGFMVSSGNGE